MKYFKENLHNKGLLALSHIVLGVMSAMLSSWTAWYFQRVMDGFSSGLLTSTTIFIYGGTLIVLCLVEYADNYPECRLAQGIYLDFKLMALKKMSKVDYTSYQSLGIGSLIQRIENGAEAGKGILFDFWFCVFKELLPGVVFSLMFIAEISMEIMAYIGIGYILVFVVTNILLKYLYQIKERILNNEELFNKHLVRGFTELVVFRTNRRFPCEIREAEAAVGEITSAKTSMQLIHEAFFTIFAVFVCIIKIIILYVSWKSQGLSAGAVVALILLVDNAYNPIAIFNVLFVQYKLDKASFKRFEDFMSMPDDKRLVSGERPDVDCNEIVFENVGFEYGDKGIFSDLCFTVPEGRVVAFVGESGSGKSTAVKLIAGLIRPNSGRVMVGSCDLAEVDLNEYYSMLSYTSQEPPVFNGTLRENIVFDKPVSDAEILTVLSRVCLGEFCDSLTLGLDTVIGERGVMLSGGERQRLALARLYFDDARIIILDEATSALDNITEDEVMQSIGELFENRTVIIIAHRLSSVRCVDDIYAFKDGAISERGSFETLMSRDSYFRKLWNAAAEV